MLSASAALASHALTPERYAGLDGAYTALIPLDRERVPASALSAAQLACDRLDAADVLLGPVSGECRAHVTVIRRFVAMVRCKTSRGCLRASARARRALSSYLADARSANRAIDGSVSDPTCRLALRTSAKYLSATRGLRSWLRLSERALKTGSRSDRRRADKRFDALDFGLSPRQKRNRFRAACG